MRRCLVSHPASPTIHSGLSIPFIHGMSAFSAAYWPLPRRFQAVADWVFPGNAGSSPGVIELSHMRYRKSTQLR